MIDIDEDGRWDYTYDSETNTLSKYVQEKDETNDNLIWYAVGLGVILSIILLIIISLTKKKGKKPGYGYVPNKYSKKR